MTAGSVATFSSLNLSMSQSNDDLVELPLVVEGVVVALMVVVGGVGG